METHEFKVFDFSTADRNGRIISKDALKGQDGKQIPVKFGSGVMKNQYVKSKELISVLSGL